jgi:O-acetylserine/cysteine efflux transporter
MTPVDYAIALAVMVLWGLNFPMAKLGLSELPPLLFMTVRFCVVAALLCPFAPLPRDKLKGVLALALLLGSVHFSLMFMGIAGMDAATASILSQSQVPFAALLAALFYRDHLGWRRGAGMAVAFLGTMLIAGEPRFGRDPVPLLMVLGASFAWALATIQIKRIGAISGFALSGWLALFAAPQLGLLSLLLEHDQLAALAQARWAGYGGLLYSALAVTVVSYAMWYPLVRRYPVNQTMPFTLLVPIFGVADSALILGDRLSWQAALGGLATVAGVATIVLHRLPRPVR